MGGSTVVNNAVSFDLPPQVLERWNDPQLYDSGLDTNQLMASFARVRSLSGYSRKTTRISIGSAR